MSNLKHRAWGTCTSEFKSPYHRLFSLNNPFGNTSRYRSYYDTLAWLSSDRVCLHGYFNLPTLEAHLEAIRLLSSASEEVQDLALRVLPLDRLPLNYLHQLGDDRTTAYRASCLAWAVTGGTLVPRELQLLSCLDTHNNQNSLICAGTESGKTLSLPIALNLLLDNPAHGSIYLTISTLKQLQITQVSGKQWLYVLCALDCPGKWHQHHQLSRQQHNE